MTQVDERLSEPTKVAILGYLFKIFIPSTVVLSLLSAAFGFLINRWAYGEAYVKAYGEASSEIVKIASAVGLVKGDVDASKAQVDASKAQVDASKTQVEIAREQVLSVFQTATNARMQLENLVTKDYDDMAKTLLRDDKFRSSLANVSQEQMKTLERRIGTALAQCQVEVEAKWGTCDGASHVVPPGAVPGVNNQFMPVQASGMTPPGGGTSEWSGWQYASTWNGGPFNCTRARLVCRAIKEIP
jgi:hypothetical protein